MSHDGNTPSGADLLGDDESASLKDFIDAQQGTSFSIVHVPDDGVSESSTLLPSIRGPASLAAQSLQQQQQQGAEGEEGSIWWTLVRAIFSAEGMLRMGLLAAMAATVGLAVARALEGVFSPGLVGGGGLLMILCLVANKRELRG